MINDISELLTPRILVVDDEHQIHASLKLRLGKQYEVTYCFDGVDGLEKLRSGQFDLCITDIHMPKMNGLKFVEIAQEADPCLGFVILSAFDSQENLLKMISLQVYAFIPKPLPAKGELEGRLSEWIRRTRRRRKDFGLAAQADEIAAQSHVTQLERDAELVASETARDALSQTASFLTTIHAHLLAASSLVATRFKSDPSLSPLWRNLDEARKTADAARTAAESFFGSAYGTRDSSPAILGEGLRHAVEIALRSSGAEASRKTIDFSPPRERTEIRGLTGIDFLMLIVPAILAAIEVSPGSTTTRISLASFDRMETLLRDPSIRDRHWLNRKHALCSHMSSAITITCSGASLSRQQADSWIQGRHKPFSAISARGLVSGIQKCRGLLGFSISPSAETFSLVIALPV